MILLVGLDLFSLFLWDINHLNWVFANGQEDRGSIAGRAIRKTQKMVLSAASLNTQHYKVRIKSKVEKSWERSSALPDTSV